MSDTIFDFLPETDEFDGEIDDRPVYNETELFTKDELDDYYAEQQGCECEVDWTCGACKAAGRFGGFTWIETRYQGLDAEEARANGAWWDL